MKIILDEIINSGIFGGLKIKDNINDFKRLYPDELPCLENKKHQYRIFKIDPIQFSFTGDTLSGISLKCYFGSMKFFLEGKPVKIIHSIEVLKEFLAKRGLPFVENRKISDSQINLEVNQTVTFIYSIEDNGDVKLAQIDSLAILK